MDFHFIEIGTQFPLPNIDDLYCSILRIKSLLLEKEKKLNFQWIINGISLKFQLDFQLISIGISLKFQLDLQLIPLVFQRNCYWIQTGFPIDFHFYVIEISSGYPIYFIEMTNDIGISLSFLLNLKSLLNFYLISNFLLSISN